MCFAWVGHRDEGEGEVAWVPSLERVPFVHRASDHVLIQLSLRQRSPRSIFLSHTAQSQHSGAAVLWLPPSHGAVIFSDFGLGALVHASCHERHALFPLLCVDLVLQTAFCNTVVSCVGQSAAQRMVGPQLCVLRCPYPMAYSPDPPFWQSVLGLAVSLVSRSCVSCVRSLCPKPMRAEG